MPVKAAATLRGSAIAWIHVEVGRPALRVPLPADAGIDRRRFFQRASI
jgi:hypothetical protein